MEKLDLGETIEELVTLDNDLQVGTSFVIAVLIDALCDRGVLERRDILQRLDTRAAHLVAIDPGAMKQMCPDQVIEALRVMDREK